MIDDSADYAPNARKKLRRELKIGLTIALGIIVICVALHVITDNGHTHHSAAYDPKRTLVPIEPQGQQITSLEAASGKVGVSNQAANATTSEDSAADKYSVEWAQFMSERNKVEDDYVLRRNKLAEKYPKYRYYISDLSDEPTDPPTSTIPANRHDL